MSQVLPAVFARAPRIGATLPLVKVCGLTRAEDVDLAVASGASAVGFVFWPRSPRVVDVQTAARLRARVPGHVAAVGVFVDESPDRVAEVARDVGLDAVQLHGDEASSARRVIGVPIVKAVVGGTHDAEWIASPPDEVVLLIDARGGDQPGGTGRVADWDAARRIACARALVLAGGLTATNVADAVGRVGPAVLDVSSGVESSPGIKDAGRMRAFFAALAAMETSER